METVALILTMETRDGNCCIDLGDGNCRIETIALILAMETVAWKLSHRNYRIDLGDGNCRIDSGDGNCRIDPSIAKQETQYALRISLCSVRMLTLIIMFTTILFVNEVN